MTENPKGFTCECGEYIQYSGYVYAHWNDVLTHICEKCKRKHVIIQGIASLKLKKEAQE